MRTTDTRGRTWLKTTEVKDGMTVELDGGFICHDSGLVTIFKDGEDFYFNCDEGRHYLAGQRLVDGDHYVGIYPGEKNGQA